MDGAVSGLSVEGASGFERGLEHGRQAREQIGATLEPNSPTWPAHRILLGSHVYIIEGLTNLERLRGRRVRFAALPLHLPGLTGCPVRAVAWIDS